MSSSQTSSLVTSDVGQWVKLIATSVDINHLRDPKGLKCCVLLNRRRYDLLPDAPVGSGMWEHKERKIKKKMMGWILVNNTNQWNIWVEAVSSLTVCFSYYLNHSCCLVLSFACLTFLRPWLLLVWELITFPSMCSCSAFPVLFWRILPCVCFLSSHITSMFFLLPFLISLMSCIWPSWTRPLLCSFSVPSSISVYLGFFPPVLWILLLMEFTFWDCFFLLVSLDICLWNHCPDSCYMFTCCNVRVESSGVVFFIFYHEFINPELFTQLWPVKYTETHSHHSQRHDWSVAQELLIVYIFVRAGTEIMANPNEVF